jgi:VanZ family protein
LFFARHSGRQLLRIPSLSDERIRPAFRLMLWVCVLAIAYLAFAPIEHVPGAPSDKLNHFFAFSVLAWLADMAYPGRRLAPHRFTLLLGYGLLIELIQGFLPYRELSPLDFAADAAGILFYNTIVWIRRRWWHTPRATGHAARAVRALGSVPQAPPARGKPEQHPAHK